MSLAGPALRVCVFADTVTSLWAFRWQPLLARGSAMEIMDSQYSNFFCPPPQLLPRLGSVPDWRLFPTPHSSDGGGVGGILMGSEHIKQHRLAVPEV